MAAKAEEGGYDLDFVSPPPDPLLCLICQAVAKEPQQHVTCGRLFCKSCLERYQRRRGSNACPNCRQSNPQYFPDSKSNREVLSLIVKCPGAKKAGCEWEGELRSLEEHKSTCPYIPVPCPRECGSENILRRDLESHLQDDCSERDYDCPHCNETGRYKERVTSHLQDCLMAPTMCPNEGCGQEIGSSLVQFHVVTNCEFTVLPCRYRAHGCGAELPRRDLEAHENDHKLHLEMITKYTQSKISSLENEVKKLENVNSTFQKSMDKLTTSNKALEKNVKELEKNVKKLKVVNNFLWNHRNHKQLTFKIANYAHQKKLKKVFDSPSFYSSPTGYRMKIMVYLNGCGSGEGTHMSVFLHLRKGDHDDTLNWPFVGEVSVTLLNQLEDRDHHTMKIKITPEMNFQAGDYWGHPTYIPHTHLGLHSVPVQPHYSNWHHPNKNIQHLKDDSLYFKVSAHVPDVKPWLEATLF